MIDLTPLDVRKKRGDFRRGIRGYDPDEVDQFLELVSERLEELVKENVALKERADGLADRIGAQEGREKAVQEALVTAQELRAEIRSQARQEADLIRREAEMEARTLRERGEEEARRIRDDVERVVEQQRQELKDLDRARTRFLKSMRGLVEREMDALEVEEARAPSSDFPEGVVDSLAKVDAVPEDPEEELKAPR